MSPGFEPTAKDVVRINEIVRRLDGLPLAIELAAARLLTLEVSEVAAGLDRRFRLLTSGSRTSSRHGSLGAAVAWSVGLLDPELRRVFADVSVFAGSFTVGDTAAVSGLDRDDAAAALDQLAERSLVMRAPGRRYLLLETLRAFGAERAGGGRARRPRRGTGTRTTWWSGSRPPTGRCSTRAGRGCSRSSTRGCPSCRNALGWLLEQGDLERAGRLVTALQDYGFLRLRPDVLGWADRVIDADPDAREPAGGRDVGGQRVGDVDGRRPGGDRGAHPAGGADRRGERGRARRSWPRPSAARPSSKGGWTESATHYRRGRRRRRPPDRPGASSRSAPSCSRWPTPTIPHAEGVATALLEEVGGLTRSARRLRLVLRRRGGPRWRRGAGREPARRRHRASPTRPARRS